MSNLVRNYPIPIVIKTILFQKSSGELVINRAHSSKRLFFIEGQLAYANSTMPEEKLGLMLLAKKAITTEQAKRLDSAHRNDRGARIGSLLVKAGVLTERELFFHLAWQSKQIAAASFGLSDGKWTYCKGTPEILGGQQFAIPLQGVILEGMKRIANLPLFKSLLSLFPLLVSRLPKSLEGLLTPFDLRFYKSIFSHSGLRAKQIQEKIAFPGDMFWKKTLLFYLLNVIEFNEAAPFLACDAETRIVPTEILRGFEDI